MVTIGCSGDIIAARQEGRDIALGLGFADTEAVLIATAISELARNIVVYAKPGQIRIAKAYDRGQMGVTLVAKDNGSGIRDVERVLAGGYSTSGGLGLGISGVRQIMDEFAVDTTLGRGTVIVTTKWLP
ncbi:MAG: ATP-binding protein [Halofilum sp. (in: g-proteobacteria)]